MPAHVVSQPVVRHTTLKTTFTGIPHAASTPEVSVHQYRGIKYASIPGRFRQSKLFSTYLSRTDATRFGPICPQPHGKTMEEELINVSEEDFPPQNFKQIESECLNLNITCPGGLTRESRLPVMVWIHGGGNRGSGSHWLYDGGAFVQNSIALGKPIILVTINYRLGLLGFAASPQLRVENEAAGDEGVGNYGLRDQQVAFQWVNHFILDFGGDPSNVTVFGESTGAADILCHLHSSSNAAYPLFQRAIIQSPLIDHNIPEVHAAGSNLSRVMSLLRVSSVEELRKIDASKLVSVTFSSRAVDDGVFFVHGWRERMFPHHGHHHHHHSPPHSTTYPLTGHSVIDQHVASHHIHCPSKPIAPNHFHLSPHTHPPPTNQPIMIGDCSFESFLYSGSASLWTPSSVTRRIKAICGSLTKASVLLRVYDISAHTPEEDLPDRILDLINDTRFAWPTECTAEAHRKVKVAAGPSVKEVGGATAHANGGVWRYVFDQESPKRGIPHHASDLVYLFDNARPASVDAGDSTSFECPTSYDDFPDSFSDSDDSYSEDSSTGPVSDESWGVPVVTPWTYTHIRDTIQSKWLAFAYGEAPWRENSVFVFGPEGETGERSEGIFEGRRRRAMWKRALEPLGREMVQKIGVELGNGPVGGAINVPEADSWP